MRKFLPILALTILLAAAPATQPSPQFPTSVADAACALRLMEAAMRDNPLTDTNAADINRRFDRVVSDYFSGGLTTVVQGMHAIELDTADRNSATQHTLASLSVHLDHAINLNGADLAGTLGQLYPVDRPATLPDLVVELVRRDAAGVPVVYAQSPVTFAPGDKPITFTLKPKPDQSSGRYGIILRTGRSYRIVGAANIVDDSLDALRLKLVGRLDLVKPDTDDLKHAVAVCRSRVALLNDAPSDAQFINLVTDFSSLAGDVTAEVIAIEAGKNPYDHRLGDYWCLLDGRIKTPMRIYAPAQARAEKPIPVIIALHGLGGDENLFMVSYGAGEIKTLADRHGFLVVSPLTYAVMRDQTSLDRILAHISRDYTIDRDRVYVIGHSLGTGPAQDFAIRDHDKIAAAALISGLAGPEKAQPMAPTLVVSADLDGIVNPKTTRDAAAAAKVAGLPIETKEYANYGHMFIVEKSLPEVVDWLLGHTLSR